MGKKSRKNKNKTLEKLIRYTIGLSLLVFVFAYYIHSIQKVVKRTKTKVAQKHKYEKKVTVKTTLYSKSDIFKEDFFYQVGEGKFEENKTDNSITIKPYDDTFVSLTHQEPLPQVVFGDIEISFEYKFTLSGNHNPAKQGGAVLILISKNAYKTLYTTYPLCSAISEDWRKCNYTIKNGGNASYLILRFGGTSYYKELKFKNIKVEVEIEKTVKTEKSNTKIKNIKNKNSVKSK